MKSMCAVGVVDLGEVRRSGGRVRRRSGGAGSILIGFKTLEYRFCAMPGAGVQASMGEVGGDLDTCT